MHLSFHGADRSVTGSCHMVECAGARILIDCGLFQGGRELDEENAEPFGFDPAAIDVLLLTHAHLDHCGRLPLLVKRGFRGEIITTAATRELAKLVMLDAAHLQEEEAAAGRRHAGQRTARGGGAAALHDARRARQPGLFRPQGDLRPADGDRTGHSATFFDAGHILGSASILLELAENGRGAGACCSRAISAMAVGRCCATRWFRRSATRW